MLFIRVHCTTIRHTWEMKHEETTRIKQGSHTYCMRRWLRLHEVQPIMSSYPVPMSMLFPRGIDHNMLPVNYAKKSCPLILNLTMFVWDHIHESEPQTNHIQVLIQPCQTATSLHWSSLPSHPSLPSSFSYVLSSVDRMNFFWQCSIDNEWLRSTGNCQLNKLTVTWRVCLASDCQDCQRWTLFIFIFSLLFFFFLLFYFLFLEQPRLGVISHAVTSVTTWWHSHEIDHGT